MDQLRSPKSIAMPAPSTILRETLNAVESDSERFYVIDEDKRNQIDFICRNLQNRAGVRFLMACLLAKLHEPNIDIRMPYTEIGGDDCYSGRQYDERYITPFVEEHDLPCNVTTAFLTPAFRNHEIMLSRNANLMGRPRELYEYVLSLLDDVARKKLASQDLLSEIVRNLVLMRDEQKSRMATLLANLRQSDSSQLTVDAIVNIVQQHLSQRHSSRLPVLAFQAIYKTIESRLNEYLVPLQAHNAADSQTQSLGDIEVAIKESDQVVTVYEMKTREITRADISQALRKLVHSHQDIKQYLFITTKPVSDGVAEEIHSTNEQHYGVEFAALDCMSFVRYFLHLFYQQRLEFLDIYQELVLGEPESGVRHPLKEVFLTLRQAAESSGNYASN